MASSSSHNHAPVKVPPSWRGWKSSKKQEQMLHQRSSVDETPVFAFLYGTRGKITIWFFWTIAIGFTIYNVYLQYLNKSKKYYPNDVAILKLLPLKLVSRLWGWINSIPLPVFLRVPILSWYSRAYGCNLEEAEDSDLSHYRCLGDFFRRALKPGCRPIDVADVVSPADGTIVHFGLVNAETVEQVKGVTYSLSSFLGPTTFHHQNLHINNNKKNVVDVDVDVDIDDDSSDDEACSAYHEKLLISNDKQKTSLYHCVIYLASGDYHRFHSPSDWVIHYRRHFSGKLLSIRPSWMSWIEDLFTLNERVVYYGSWTHGFFSMAAVGATNVGSVRVYFDEKLKTNRFLCRHGSFSDMCLRDNPINRKKGEPFGEFNLGSTIVLIFEAPKNLECHVGAGQKVKFGQRLFCSPSEPKHKTSVHYKV